MPSPAITGPGWTRVRSRQANALARASRVSMFARRRSAPRKEDPLGHRSTSGFVWGSKLRTGSVHLELTCSALALAATCYSGDASAFGNNIGFGVGLYTDSAERTNESEPTFGNDQQTDGSFDMETDSSLNLHLWYLRAPNPAGSFRVLWGGGIAFYDD